MHNPLVSIIVPVYNVEKYLCKCLNSIINQTYKDLEIILVDDGSKDTSGQICDEYASKDNRIHVIHKENGGVSSARNKGLAIATGEWVLFADSDDILPNDALSYYAEVVNTYEVDMVLGSYVECNEDGKIIKVVEGKVSEIVDPEAEVAEEPAVEEVAQEEADVEVIPVEEPEPENEEVSIEDRVAALEERVAAFTDGLNQIVNSLAALEGRIAELEGKLAKVEEPAAEPIDEQPEVEENEHKSKLSYLRK